MSSGTVAQSWENLKHPPTQAAFSTIHRCSFVVSTLACTTHSNLSFFLDPLQTDFLASFMLAWCVPTGAGTAAYPLDTIRHRMMMTSGEVSLSTTPAYLETSHPYICSSSSSTRPPSNLQATLCRTRACVPVPFSRVLEPTFSVAWLVQVRSLCTTSCSFSCLARNLRAALAKLWSKRRIETKFRAARLLAG